MKNTNFDEILNKSNNSDNEEGESKLKQNDDFQKINLERYKDKSGLTLKKLETGFWFLKHKKTLIYIVYTFLIIIGIVTWSRFFYTFGSYIFLGMKQDQANIYGLVTNPGIEHSNILKIAANQFNLSPFQVIKTDVGTYDLIVKIENPNKNYYSHFSYTLKVEGKDLGPFKDYIFPEEEKYLLILDQEFTKTPRNISINFNHSWTKINRHTDPNWESAIIDKVDFSFKNEEFVPYRDSNLSEELRLSLVEFDITNESPYSYYDVQLVILLYNKGKLVSANNYLVEKLYSKETRHVNATWPDKVLRVDEIRIYPSIDIDRSDVYIIP